MNEIMGSKCYIVLYYNDIFSYFFIVVILILSYMYIINYILKKDICIFENI